MTDRKNKSLTITPKKGSKLTRDQQWFNARVKKLQKLQKELAEKKELVPQIQSYYHEHLASLTEEIGNKRGQVLLGLFDIKKKFGLAKKEKETLYEMYEKTAWGLIENHRQEALIPYMKEVMGNTYEEMKEMEQEEGRRMMKQMAKEEMGLDMDFSDFNMDDLKDPAKLAELFQNVGESMKEKLEGEQKGKASAQTASQKKAEEKKKEETKNLTKTMKSVYNELVKALHPDKEQDEKERELKTQQMQEVTQAYKEEDFVTLLNLRLRILGKGHSEDLEKLSAKELKVYNKLLLEQIKEIEFVLEEFKYAGEFSDINPAAEYYQFGKGAFEEIDDEKIRLKEEISALNKELEMVKTRVGAKKLLKEIRQMYDQQDDNSVFGNLLEMLMNEMDSGEDDGFSPFFFDDKDDYQEPPKKKRRTRKK